MNNVVRGCLLVLVSLVLSCAAVPARGQSCAGGAEMPRASLASALHRGGFSGVLDDSASIRFAGCLNGAGEALSVYYYERVWGSARHVAARLIVLSNAGEYLGMYAVPGPPSAVHGNQIVFPVPDRAGNVITLRDGTLPRRVRIDGELRDLFK